MKKESEKRTVQLLLMLTKAEKNKLKELAKKENLDISKYVRKKSLEV